MPTGLHMAPDYMYVPKNYNTEESKSTVNLVNREHVYLNDLHRQLEINRSLAIVNLVKVLSFSQLLSRGRPQNLSTSHDLTNMGIGPVGDPAGTSHIRLCR